MNTILLTIHLIFAVLLVGVILIQKGGGDALSGLGASSGGGGGMMSARGAKTFLTRATAILFALFLSTSIVLAYGAKQGPAANSAIDDLLSDLPAPANSVAPNTPASVLSEGNGLDKALEVEPAPLAVTPGEQPVENLAPSQEELDALVEDVAEEPPTESLVEEPSTAEPVTP